MTVGQRIYTLIQAIAAEPSKNAKQALLKNVDPAIKPMLQYVLTMAYDGKYTYGIKYVEPQKGDGGPLDITDIEFERVLRLLHTRELAGNAARDAVEQMMAFLDAPTAELFRRIIHKDLRADFGTSTINKVWPGLISDIPYMRCSSMDGSKIANWDWAKGIYVQLKADGMFQRAIVDGGTVTFVSRAGEYMPADALPGLKAIILQATDGQPCMLDGELLVRDNTGKILPRKDGNGMLNSVRQGGELPEGHDPVYSVWDYVPADEPADAGARYEHRFNALTHIVGKLCESHQMSFHVIPTKIAYSLQEAFKFCQGWMAEGLEGAVAKTRDGLWKDHTSPNQVKLKVAFQVEVRFTGFIEGAKGKKTAKTFGALTYESECGMLTGSCSGFTDKERAEINANRDDWVNAIGTVEANDITKSRDSDTWALSHPRFIERRTDKTVADTLEQMQATLASTRATFGATK